MMASNYFCCIWFCELWCQVIGDGWIMEKVCQHGSVLVSVLHALIQGTLPCCLCLCSTQKFTDGFSKLFLITQIFAYSVCLLIHESSFSTVIAKTSLTLHPSHPWSERSWSHVPLRLYCPVFCQKKEVKNFMDTILAYSRRVTYVISKGYDIFRRIISTLFCTELCFFTTCSKDNVCPF